MSTVVSVVDAADRSLDRVRRGDADPDRHAEREPQLVREHDVGRVGDRDHDGAVLEEVDRQRQVAPGQVLGQQHRRLDLDRGEVELDELELVLLREHPRDLCPRGVAPLDQDLAEPLLGRHALLDQRVLELLRRDRAVADEQRAERRQGVAGSFHDAAYRQEISLG